MKSNALVAMAVGSPPRISLSVRQRIATVLNWPIEVPRDLGNHRHKELKQCPHMGWGRGGL